MSSTGSLLKCCHYNCAFCWSDDCVVVHLRLRPMDHNSNRHMFPSTSGIVYWELELESSAISGEWDKNMTQTHKSTYLICMYW